MSCSGSGSARWPSRCSGTRRGSDRRPTSQALVAVAKKLELAGTQYWLATNGQRGAAVQVADRYPMPNWHPVRGWRIEPSLAFAHAIQESNFQTGRGQPGRRCRAAPGAAGHRRRTWPAPPACPTRRHHCTSRPTIWNMGRASSSGCGDRARPAGCFRKIIASYNAGPLPVGRWASIPDRGDPLLWMESIPYWETRFYVPAVMRNLWVYEGLARRPTPTLSAMAQHRWPAFPALQTP